MQARQFEKGALIGEVNTQLILSELEEITPFGIRVKQNDVGEVRGIYTGHHSDTTTVFFRNDGTYDWDSKYIQRLDSGDIVVGIARGTGETTGPTTHVSEGEVTFMTQSPRFSYLNNKRGKIEITADPKTGENQIKVFAL